MAILEVEGLVKIYKGRKVVDGVHFEVSLGDGLATGLFLDQRANWGRVRSLASGASFLNLFSYTGAFTVSA